MNVFFSNPWTKRIVSFFTAAYVLMLIALAYGTFLYTLEIKNEKSFSIVYIISSLLFLGLMIYSRKQVFTSIISMIMLPIVFIILVCNLGNWLLIIPPLAVAITMFFVSGAHETLKTILGTIYLLLYILGLIAFFLARFFIVGSSEQTKLNDKIPLNSVIWELYDMDEVIDATQNSVSPNGKYRFYILDVKDNNKGSVGIFVEPNDSDKHYKFFTLAEKGYQRRIAIGNTRGELPEIKWVGDDSISYKFESQSDFKTSKIIKPAKNYLEIFS